MLSEEKCAEYRRQDFTIIALDMRVERPGQSRCGPRPFAVHDLHPTTTHAEPPSTCASLDVRSSGYRAMYLKLRDAPRPTRTPTRLRFADATIDRGVSRPTPGGPVDSLRRRRDHWRASWRRKPTA